MGILQQFGQHYAPAINAAYFLIFLVTALIGSVSAIIAVRQLSATRKIHNFLYILNTREHTLEYSISRNVSYRESRLALDKAFGVLEERRDAISVAEIREKGAQHPDIDHHIRTLLANYENMALAVHAKVADDDVAFHLLGAPFLKITTLFMPYIEDRRETRPSRYLNLLRLKAAWEKRDPRDIDYYPIFFGHLPKPRRLPAKQR